MFTTCMYIKKTVALFYTINILVCFEILNSRHAAFSSNSVEMVTFLAIWACAPKNLTMGNALYTLHAVLSYSSKMPQICNSTISIGSSFRAVAVREIHLGLISLLISGCCHKCSLYLGQSFRDVSILELPLKSLIQLQSTVIIDDVFLISQRLEYLLNCS